MLLDGMLLVRRWWNYLPSLSNLGCEKTLATFKILCCWDWYCWLKGTAGFISKTCWIEVGTNEWLLERYLTARPFVCLFCFFVQRECQLQVTKFFLLDIKYLGIDWIRRSQWSTFHFESLCPQFKTLQLHEAELPRQLLLWPDKDCGRPASKQDEPIWLQNARHIMFLSLMDVSLASHVSGSRIAQHGSFLRVRFCPSLLNRHSQSSRHISKCSKFFPFSFSKGYFAIGSCFSKYVYVCQRLSGRGSL